MLSAFCSCVLLLLASSVSAGSPDDDVMVMEAAASAPPEQGLLAFTVVNGATWNGWTILGLEKSFADVIKKHGGGNGLAPASSHVSTSILSESSVFTSFDVGTKEVSSMIQADEQQKIICAKHLYA